MGSYLAAHESLLDFGARFYDPSTAIFLQQDPLAEKYYNISPYAYCANNPVNFVDPDGKVPIALPILGYMVLKSAVTAGGIIFTIAVLDKWEQSHDSSKYNPGYDHQRRRDRQNKRALDQAQLNVQNSIKKNFPDPDDDPELRCRKNFCKFVILSLNLMGQNHDLLLELIEYYINKDRENVEGYFFNAPKGEQKEPENSEDAENSESAENSENAESPEK